MNKTHHWIKVIAGIGNTGILYNHVQYLEKKIPQQTNAESDTEYYCWLLLNCILVYQRLEHMYIRTNPGAENLELKINSDVIMQSLKNGLDKKTLESRFQAIDKVITLRHRLVHLGVPNMKMLVSSKKYLAEIEDIYNGNVAKARKLFSDSDKVLKKVNLPSVEMIATDSRDKVIGSFGRIGNPKSKK